YRTYPGGTPCGHAAVVADLDLDRSAEIVFGTPSQGFQAVSDAAAGFVNPGPTWNQYQYFPGDVAGDGSVPASPGMPWVAGASVWRAGPEPDTVRGAELYAVLDDVCAACDGAALAWPHRVSVWYSLGDATADGAYADVAFHAVGPSSDTVVATV